MLRIKEEKLARGRLNRMKYVIEFSLFSSFSWVNVPCQLIQFSLMRVTCWDLRRFFGFLMNFNDNNKYQERWDEQFKLSHNAPQISLIGLINFAYTISQDENISFALSNWGNVSQRRFFNFLQNLFQRCHIRCAIMNEHMNRYSGEIGRIQFQTS